jgi:hypothetical protein
MRPREAHITSLSGATWPAGELQRGIDGGGSRFCHIPPPGLTVDPDARTLSVEQTTIVARATLFWPRAGGRKQWR